LLNEQFNIVKLFKSTFLPAALIASLVSSCISTKKVESLFGYYRPIINYYPDSELKLDKLPFSVAIGEIKMDSLVRQKTTVTKKSGWIVPLILVNVWESKKTCYQGISSYYTPIQNSFEYYLKKESERSGIFYLDSLDADYKLDIIIQKVEAYGQYKDFGFSFLNYALYYEGITGPAESAFVVTYQLKKKQLVVRKETFMSSRKIDFDYYDNKNRKVLLKAYSVRMAEATSKNTKTVIEAIIVDLNSYFRSLN